MIVEEICGSFFVIFVPSQRIFFSSKQPPHDFLMNNFDGIVLEGASFVIRSSSGAFVVARVTRLVETRVPMAELRTA